jgi:hypothetical protein
MARAIKRNKGITGNPIRELLVIQLRFLAVSSKGTEEAKKYIPPVPEFISGPPQSKHQ